MLKFFRSLRFRLVALFVAIFGLIQILLGGTALVLRERALHNEFDQQLTERAQGIAVELLREERPFSEQQLRRAVDAGRRAMHFRDFYVQLRDGRGEVLERSTNLGVYRLPLPNLGAGERHSASGHITSIKGGNTSKLVGRGAELRMVTLYVDTTDARPFYLQAATGTVELRESVVFLRTLFAAVIPIGLVAAAVASWFVAGSAVRRINRVAEAAHQLSPHRLAERLTDPTSDELGAMVSELNEMLDRLEVGFRAQARFIQDASHELKTPISVLLSEAQVLRLSHADPEARRFAGSVEEEMRRLGELIESLLTLTRTDGRSPLAQRRDVAVNEAVVAAVQQCDVLGRQCGVRITPRLAMPDDDTEPTVRGDLGLLTVMVANLIRNAIRFSPTDRPVEVGVWVEGEEAVVEVRDHGPGVPEEELERIFKRFHRAPNNGDGPHASGMGLGLTIARSIAELHHGTLTAANADGGGCRFTATLPLTEQAVP